MITFTNPEKYILVILIITSSWLLIKSVLILLKIIQRGKGNLNSKNIGIRFVSIFFRDLVILKSTWRTRFWSNLFHLTIVWGFILYLPVNILDILKYIFPEISLSGWFENLTDFFIDIFSTLIIISVIYFLVRRFISRNSPARIRADILLHPDAMNGIRRDSIIVAGLILIHVGSRLLGESLLISIQSFQTWQPVAKLISGLWINGDTSVVSWHIASWFSLIALFVFIPYFLRSKHIHLFFAPLNHLLKPDHKSLSSLEKIDFENENLEIFGSLHLEELGKSSILDAYACIMCFRCQDVCPPYQTGKQLSPAALEINKRYYLNNNLVTFINKQEPSPLLTEYAISEQAIWACTACGACVDICPVGVDPLRDILEIRRGMVLMEDHFPKPFHLLFRNLERYANPWGINSTDRLKWTDGLNVPTIEEIPDPEILWWVGCAGAFDEKAQKTSRAFAGILNQSGVRFSILGNKESCTGDAARRAGREDIFMELSARNIELLKQVNPTRIVTTCPHCLHTLKNEYPDFGGDFQVIHHSQFLAELISDFRFGNTINKPGIKKNISLHDPCYISRFDNSEISISAILSSLGDDAFQIPNSGKNTFCCGGGGAQMWKEEESGRMTINQARLLQVQNSNTECLITACPFCKTRLTDAATQSGKELAVYDLAEHLLNQANEEKL